MRPREGAFDREGARAARHGCAQRWAGHPRTAVKVETAGWPPTETTHNNYLPTASTERLHSPQRRSSPTPCRTRQSAQPHTLASSPRPPPWDPTPELPPLQVDCCCRRRPGWGSPRCHCRCRCCFCRRRRCPPARSRRQLAKLPRPPARATTPKAAVPPPQRSTHRPRIAAAGGGAAGARRRATGR
jgi:hypothetical protein